MHDRHTHIVRMTKDLPFIKSGSPRQFQALETDPTLSQTTAIIVSGAAHLQRFLAHKTNHRGLAQVINKLSIIQFSWEAWGL